MGDVCKALKRYTEALELFEKSVQIRIDALGPDHVDVAKTYNSIADVYEAMGLYEKARENRRVLPS